MRNFTKFKRGEKETRLDIFCSKLNKKESEELSDILKNMGFVFCYMESDSILAFLTGGYSRVKNIMKRLEKYYGFNWTEDKLILENTAILRK
ncbi:hypothetical protein ES703_108916 [subsurface metagenome]